MCGQVGTVTVNLMKSLSDAEWFTGTSQETCLSLTANCESFVNYCWGASGRPHFDYSYETETACNASKFFKDILCILQLYLQNDNMIYLFMAAHCREKRS
jgi:hypothetical protein